LDWQVGKKSRFVGYGDGEPCSVEELVLQHFRGEGGGDGVGAGIGDGWVGWHCEGRPLMALMPLLMWDELFMSVPDVFQ
ncbi:unnamed protein product, partial [Discosporangium mesarthrocarpum]